jgi:hypothetical protein
MEVPEGLLNVVRKHLGAKLKVTDGEVFEKAGHPQQKLERLSINALGRLGIEASTAFVMHGKSRELEDDNHPGEEGYEMSFTYEHANAVLAAIDALVCRKSWKVGLRGTSMPAAAMTIRSEECSLSLV